MDSIKSTRLKAIAHTPGRYSCLALDRRWTSQNLEQETAAAGEHKMKVEPFQRSVFVIHGRTRSQLHLCTPYFVLVISYNDASLRAALLGLIVQKTGYRVEIEVIASQTEAHATCLLTRNRVRLCRACRQPLSSFATIAAIRQVTPYRKAGLHRKGLREVARIHLCP